jgi:hypothetical protein
MNEGPNLPWFWIIAISWAYMLTLALLHNLGF